MDKSIGGKAYGSIAHLPGSRLGPGDHHVTEQQAAVLTEQTRNKHDTVIVTEKLDGSCTAVARLDNGSIVALGRAGYLAASSPHEQHRLFAAWVEERCSLFAAILQPGERLVGEWLAQVHGTRYMLAHEPWYVFDLMRDKDRATQGELLERIDGHHICIPRTIGLGSALAVDEGMRRCAEWSMAHADDGDEGLVYRLETSKNARPPYVAYLAKYVRPDKRDGRYLPELTGGEPLWNWHPAKSCWWEVDNDG